MGRRLDVSTSLLGTLMAQGRGVIATKNSKKPSKPLELYDIEGCPYCRIVREALTDLDLDVIIYPCPKQGERYRTALQERGGKSQFPYIIDPNTNTEMYESVDIIQYLYKEYGDGKIPHKRQIQLVRIPASMTISGLRILKGMLVKASLAPNKPLELYSFESSPFARLVRERLCELEIPYLVRNVGRTDWQDHVPPPIRERVLEEYTPRNANRQTLMDRCGSVSVPYLIDPNTDTELGDSAAILDYINSHYDAAMADPIERGTLTH